MAAADVAPGTAPGAAAGVGVANGRPASVGGAGARSSHQPPATSAATVRAAASSRRTPNHSAHGRTTAPTASAIDRPGRGRDRTGVDGSPPPDMSTMSTMSTMSAMSAISDVSDRLDTSPRPQGSSGCATASLLARRTPGARSDAGDVGGGDPTCGVSEQLRGQLAAVVGGAGVVGTHQLEDVDELLASLVVGLDPRQQAGQRGVVVVLRGAAEPG